MTTPERDSDNKCSRSAPENFQGGDHAAVARDSDRAPLRSDPVTVTHEACGGGVAAKTQAHKAKLAADPRFAAWLGIDQDPPPDPATERRIAERNELIRIAAQRIVENEASGAPTADPATLAWARDFVATTGPAGRLAGHG